MQELKCPQLTDRLDDERGISLLETLIVVAILSVVAAFAIMRISAAQRAMRVTNSTREFISYLERARVDSVRRRPMSVSEMASVQINTVDSYSVTLDWDGDGQLDPPRTITVPAAQGAAFAGVSIPTTISFDWRGRPVNVSGNPINLAFRMQDASGGNVQPINLTSGGDTSLGNNISTNSVVINQMTDASANVNPRARIP